MTPYIRAYCIILGMQMYKVQYDKKNCFYLSMHRAHSVGRCVALQVRRQVAPQRAEAPSLGDWADVSGAGPNLTKPD